MPSSRRRGCTGAASPDRAIGRATLFPDDGVRQEPSRLSSSDSLQLVERIARLAEDKLAHDIVILDMESVVGYTDYFLVCTGNTARQTQAIAEEIELRLKREDGLLPHRAEGKREGSWILLDYVDVVVHVFTPEWRDFYRLEQLWGQVPARQFAGGPAA